jgi:hypothetical protein
MAEPPIQLLDFQRMFREKPYKIGIMASSQNRGFPVETSQVQLPQTLTELDGFVPKKNSVYDRFIQKRCERPFH